MFLVFFCSGFIYGLLVMSVYDLFMIIIKNRLLVYLFMICSREFTIIDFFFVNTMEPPNKSCRGSRDFTETHILVVCF